MAAPQGRRAVRTWPSRSRSAPNAPLPWSNGGSTARSGSRRPASRGRHRLARRRCPPTRRGSSSLRGVGRTPSAGVAGFPAVGNVGTRSAALPLRRLVGRLRPRRRPPLRRSPARVRLPRRRPGVVRWTRWRCARRCGARDRVGRGAAACSFGASTAPDLAPARSSSGGRRPRPAGRQRPPAARHDPRPPAAARTG